MYKIQYLHPTILKRLFSLIKSKQCDNIGVAPIRENGKIHIDDQAKAEVLNKQFASVFSNPNTSTTPEMTDPHPTDMPDIHIDTNGVKKLLSELNPFKASGPDGVESRFLKETADELAPAIAHVFQASLQQSTIPNAWRHALISPIYKPGKSDKSCAENYRPTSLTTVTAKFSNTL